MKHLKAIISLMIIGIYVISLIGLSSALVIKSVSTSPGEVAPGEVSNIEIEIENNLEIDVTDVSVSLDLSEVPFAPYQSSSEDSIDEIEEDDDETARFKIIALNEANPGIYKIPVSVEYIENDETKVRDSLISLTVNSEPILGVDREEGLVLKNSVNEISFRVINKGLSDVRFLEISVMDSVYYDVVSNNNVYIGDVDSDDFDSADYRVYVKSNAPDNLNFPVVITYKDSSNNEFSDVVDLNVRVYSKEEAVEMGLITQSKTGTYVIGAVVVIVLFFIYRWFRKRMKKRQDKF